jgi:hypothetical protein
MLDNLHKPKEGATVLKYQKMINAITASSIE